jgi:hypothetical protein
VNSTISAGKCIWFGIQIKVRQPNTRHSLHALKARPDPGPDEQARRVTLRAHQLSSYAAARR